MAEARKTAASKTTETSDTPAAGTAPIAAGALQQGEVVNAQVTTNPPRGVGELPSNQIAGEPGAAALQEFMQKRVDKEQAAGHRGTKMDPTPNKNYTLAGVAKGLPTPETIVVTPTGTNPQ